MVNKIKTIEEDGSIITTDSNNKAVSIATEEYVKNNKLFL